MKAHLLFPDRDFDVKHLLPWNADALTRDLALDTLIDAMAQKDRFLLDVARQALFQGPENDIATIRHRQRILEDAIERPRVIRELYAIAVEGVEVQQRFWLGNLRKYPEWTLRWASDLLESLLGVIRKLRQVTDAEAAQFRSSEWSGFFTMVALELDDGYLARLDAHLRKMKFQGGLLMSARLGIGNRGVGYVLHPPPERNPTWLERLFAPRQPGFGFDIHPRDEASHRALEELRARGLAVIAQTLGQAADHVRSFFIMLRTELAFYVGCLNLYDRLVGKGEPVCFPSPEPADSRKLSFRGLYDVGLALGQDQRVVGNDANADDRELVMVTGANQGGKSTFLRSLGIGQLMMQAGMFAPATALSASLCDGVFTHYKREEDVTLSSGKLDEELGRMSEIIDRLTLRPIILLNESFAATNEREGSEIARQILSALLEKPARMACVTHLYELARAIRERHPGDVLFLRAERRDDGARTFKLIEGEPLQTSFGEDLYETIFGRGSSHTLDGRLGDGPGATSPAAARAIPPEPASGRIGR